MCIRRIVVILIVIIRIECMANDLNVTLQQFLLSSSGGREATVESSIVYSLFHLYNENFHRSKIVDIHDTNRFAAFNDTIHAIRDHHRRGEKMFTVGLNEFSDWTPDQLENTRGLRVTQADIELTNKSLTNRSEALQKSAISSKASLPMTFDYATRFLVRTNIPAVQSIKNQATCGSCYAFAFINLLEYQYAIQFRNSMNLSEQQIVDCSTRDYGCNGGYFITTFDYFQRNSFRIDSQALYPYTGVAGTCKFRMDNYSVQYPSLYYERIATRNSVAMQYALLNYGPLWVSIFVGSNTSASNYRILRDFYSYTSGIISESACPASLYTNNHAVAIVGYGTDSVSRVPYWKVRNSWSTRWGENGYFRIYRGVNMCGIESDVYYIMKPT